MIILKLMNSNKINMKNPQKQIQKNPLKEKITQKTSNKYKLGRDSPNLCTRNMASSK